MKAFTFLIPLVASVRANDPAVILPDTLLSCKSGEFPSLRRYMVTTTNK